MFKKALLLFLVAFVAVTLGIFYINEATKSVSSQTLSKNFLITKGSSASKIGNDLYRDGLIKSPLIFKFYIQLTGIQGEINAGEFKLSPSMSLFEVIDTLQSGPAELWVTIPEGLRHNEIARKFTDVLEKDTVFYQEFVAQAKEHEGYLFPDTYLFPKETTPTVIVDKMVSTFFLKAGEDVTRDQVIMASIIERETRGDTEKPIVAGILYKRINSGWPLQVDASIQYAKGDWKPILSSDKELDSPYNTYKYQGFPPAPISNPGLFSIKAATSPQESEYWYYLHEPGGQIHYGVTLADHNQNIARYLR